MSVRSEIVEFVKARPKIFQFLLEGLQKPDLSLQCGEMLRRCAQIPELAGQLLHEQRAPEKLCEIAIQENFEISSEAFSVLRALLLQEKEMSADYLADHFESFFSGFQNLLESSEYVAKRQAAKLLSQILVDRSYIDVMLKYVANERYLQTHMILLLDESKKIQMESFQVFKIFVANPYKPPKVQQILFRNKARLLDLIERMYENNNSRDENISTDLRTVHEVIGNLSACRPAGAASTLRDVTAASSESLVTVSS
jgi:calcium binding protein 39